jgi:hypothetical protein
MKIKHVIFLTNHPIIFIENRISINQYVEDKNRFKIYDDSKSAISFSFINKSIINSSLTYLIRCMKICLNNEIQFYSCKRDLILKENR